MRYPGGKWHERKKFAKILKEMQNDRPYVEPFMGVCSVMSEMPADLPRFGFDINKYIVAMMRELEKGWEPPTDVSEERFQNVKRQFVNEESLPYSDAEIGFVLSQCSFGANFRSFARSIKTEHNFALSGSRSAIAVGNKLQGAVFHWMDYTRLEFEGCLIYCDPPYEKGNVAEKSKEFHFSQSLITKTNHKQQHFFTDEFWDKVRHWSVNNTVVVSSFNAPEDFKCIYELVTPVGLRSKSGKSTVTEKLFVLKEAFDGN